MSRIILVHWNAQEAVERAERLEKLSHDVIVFESDRGAIGLKPLRENPPEAFVIDLGRLPSHGRDIALWIRARKATRGVPIVFVEGEAKKVARIRSVLPDASYSDWASIGADLGQAIAHPPAEPVVPGSVMAGYSGTPLPKKLGIKPAARVLLLGAPDDFEATLGELPDGVFVSSGGSRGGDSVKRQARGQADVIMLFVKSQAELERCFPVAARALAEKGGLWIAWPKKASGIKSDVTQNEVRSFGLGHAFVDYKICAIDGTWSGLLFARRRKS